MSEPVKPARAAPIIYPDSDGEPMAENTLQFQWIVTIKEGLEALFRDNPDVFVAGDLFWYPVEGNNKLRRAPDALVVFGRPKGYRGSYQQWEEGGIAPQVVFEVLSPGNTTEEMTKKHHFYQTYGVEEYYVYDPEPDTTDVQGWLRQGNQLWPIAQMQGWVSPRLGVRFQLAPDGALELIRPDGERFKSYQELFGEWESAVLAAHAARTEAHAARTEAHAARTEAERLAAKLRELGIDPETL